MWDNSLMGPLSTFRSNPIVMKGMQFYDDLLTDRLVKEDEARWKGILYYK
jgi:hypothetical protein